MRAALLRRFGPPAVLSVETVQDPVPGPGQVLIEVAYASITFVETQVRAGRAPFPLPELPLIPGNGVGGIVIEVGAGVDSALLDTRVVTATGGRGGYAELVAVAADALIPVPDAVGLREAVALLADGRTALALVRNASLRPGEAVLVEAAAGGVGTCLLQLAATTGATVTGAVGSARKAAVAASLGATATVDYSVAGWEREIGPFDVVFDGVGGTIGASAVQLLRPGGRFCRYGMASGVWTEVPEARGDVQVLTGTAIDAAESHRLSTAALALAASGALAATIGQEHSLERVADAHAAIEARETIGKTLLRVAEVAA